MPVLLIAILHLLQASTASMHAMVHICFKAISTSTAAASGPALRAPQQPPEPCSALVLHPFSCATYAHVTEMWQESDWAQEGALLTSICALGGGAATRALAARRPSHRPPPYLCCQA